MVRSIARPRNWRICPHSDFDNLGAKPRMLLCSLNAGSASPVNGRGVASPKSSKYPHDGNF